MIKILAVAIKMTKWWRPQRRLGSYYSTAARGVYPMKTQSSYKLPKVQPPEPPLPEDGDPIERIKLLTAIYMSAQMQILLI